MFFVDSHCHLDFPGLAERVEEVMANARRAGVGLVLTIATRRGSWDDVRALAARHRGVVCALGVHPHNAGSEGLVDPAPLIAAAADPRVVAVGEAGLDYHYDFAPRDAQARDFRAHIAAARETGLPLVVHTREADADTMDILEEEMARGPFTGVIHCFSSSRELAERALALGFHLGIGGILTFKRSEELRRIVADMPMERLLLETDAPYLAPVPFRGKTNEPAYLVHTAEVLARVKGCDLAEVARATSDNFFRLFRRAEALCPARCG